MERFPVSAFATAARKSFNGKLNGKLIFHRTFHVPITDPDTGSVMYLHTLFCKYIFGPHASEISTRVTRLKVTTTMADHYQS